jgi:cytochrome oxidase assembly protein ShyY1
VGTTDDTGRAPARVWGVTALAVAAVLTCVVLGAWQFDRARTRDTPRVAGDPMAVPAVPLGQALPADGRVPPGAQPRAVTLTGVYDGPHQLLVPGRTVDGRQVDYVVTPLVPSTGKAVLVARGWQPVGPAGTVTAPSPPPGPVTVTGWLVPSEPLEAATVDPLSLPPGQVASITAARVAGLLPDPIVDGYVGLVEETAAPTSDAGVGAPAPLTPLPVPLVAPSVQWSVQSLFYAFEWWFFGLVVVWMWAQALGIERRRAAVDGSADQTPDVPAAS